MVVTSKICNGCKTSKPLKDFNFDSYTPTGRTYKCRQCLGYGPRKESYIDNPSPNSYHIKLQRKTEFRHARRDRIIEAYGGKCTCCEENTYKFLSIHHKFNDGQADRAAIGVGNFHKWIEDHNYPTERLELLCYNCNCSKGFNGFCHESDPVNNFSKRQTTIKKLRLEILNHYGPKCVCCGEARINLLSIEHINGGGLQHRKKVGNAATFYRWVIKNNFPKDLTILCYNCNCAKGFYGQCPHQIIHP